MAGWTDSLPGYIDLETSFLAGHNDSLPGYIDLEASFLVGHNDSLPSYIDLEPSFLRLVDFWSLDLGGTRIPLWPRTPEEVFIGKATRPSGLIGVQHENVNSYAQYGADAYVLKIAWADIEPSPGIYNWADIDNILTQYGSWRMTLRIQSGGSAPEWLKASSGGAISLYNQARDATVLAPRWWTQVAMDAWTAMIHAAGARYDRDPRVVLVSADPVMVVYSEPFILGGHPPSARSLFEAGCTFEAHTHAIKRSVDDTCKAFPTTRVELALHKELQYPTATGLGRSWPLGRAIAVELALKWRNQLCFSSYGLNVVDTQAAHPIVGTLETESDLYAWMTLRAQTDLAQGGGPVGYQLTPRGMTTKPDYAAMAQNAFDLGGWYCETSGWGILGSDFTFYDGQLKTQAVGGV